MDFERKTGADKSVDNQIDNVRQDRDVSEAGDYTGEELKFAVFCIENVAARLRVDASVIYDSFTRSSDILDSYIIPCYDVLHTQGKDYIVNDLIDRMKEKGVTDLHCMSDGYLAEDLLEEYRTAEDRRGKDG